MKKGASVRRPRRLRVALFALGSVFTLAGALVLALPVQAWEGAELGVTFDCPHGIVYFTGAHFGDKSKGLLDIYYDEGMTELDQIPWKYKPGGKDPQVIATMELEDMIEHAGRKPPFDIWVALHEDHAVMWDGPVPACAAVSPTPTPSGGVSPTTTPVTPTPTATTPSPGGSVLPTQAQTSPSPSGGVLAESVGLPNTGVPRSTMMTLAGTLIAIGLMLLTLSALIWRRPVTGRQ